MTLVCLLIPLLLTLRGSLSLETRICCLSSRAGKKELDQERDQERRLPCLSGWRKLAGRRWM